MASRIVRMEIRAAKADDVEELAAVHVGSWQAGYRGLLPQRLLDGLDPADRVDRWRQEIAATDLPRRGPLVAISEDRIVGFTGLCPCRDEDGAGLAEVASFYVDPASWRQGIGRELMAAALETLDAAGYPEATVWVLDTNESAIGFYTALGFRPDGATKTDRYGGREVVERRMRQTLRPGPGSRSDHQAGPVRGPVG